MNPDPARRIVNLQLGGGSKMQVTRTTTAGDLIARTVAKTLGSPLLYVKYHTGMIPGTVIPTRTV